MSTMFEATNESAAASSARVLATSAAFRGPPFVVALSAPRSAPSLRREHPQLSESPPEYQLVPS
eukprot:CAMPEP_0205919986 /NCGR_PEP_ID=MMETSP1325-20131115/10792_1 /ASSEMBLY_ACC=CAM_ASM_000708 /TAXON_ID=236786 /ORGANISM="Florenciella sp., Strain RCC1007" /LENGTH=63 /DNA_ID=CAMNT_0053287633 /DNA_START=131 /DNA_END=322 /DNA_ORIENTATION=-